MRVIYIGGYGRSGSTFLDLLLGQHHQVVSGGEIINLPTLELNNRGYCSCGQSFLVCQVWQETLADLLPDNADKKTQWEQLKKAQEWKATIIRFFSINILRRYTYLDSSYRDYNNSLFNTLAKSQNAEVVVDSSKTTYRGLIRPLALTQVLEGELYFLHLIRDPYAVMQSVKKGTNKALANKSAKKRHFSVLRGVLGWSIANLAALLNAKFLNKDNHLIVRYEDLILNPKKEIDKITNLLDLNASDIHSFIDGNREQCQAHLCEGNRMGKTPLVISSVSPVAKPSKKERIYHFIFCSWVELIIDRKCIQQEKLK